MILELAIPIGIGAIAGLGVAKLVAGEHKPKYTRGALLGAAAGAGVELANSVRLLAIAGA